MTRYELAERIGSGAMAEIFRGKAVAASGFEKPVAIKRILPHLSQGKRFVELLIAEANVLSHLRHRNIVQIFDVGLGPDGQYFLVMEYVDGADLGALQKSLERAHMRVPLDLGLHIGSEVCEALEYAHHQARGPDGEPMRLVHRDVSPSNVLLSRSGEVKLTDFGIAKRVEEVTSHGGVRGKFAYVSPEQASGRPVDARSDVFSVGIVLFELLLGTRLFSQMSDFKALEGICEARIPRAREIDPSIDPRLDAILARALARKLDERFPSAGDLGKELRELRYSMPATGGDPATELANLLEHLVLAERRMESKVDSYDEPTVVRLASPRGFSLNEAPSRSTSYADARQVVDSFEEEVTRAQLASLGDDDPATIDQRIDAHELEAMIAAQAEADLDGETRLVRATVPGFVGAQRTRPLRRPSSSPHDDLDIEDTATGSRRTSSGVPVPLPSPPESAPVSSALLEQLAALEAASLAGEPISAERLSTIEPGAERDAPPTIQDTFERSMLDQALLDAELDGVSAYAPVPHEVSTGLSGVSLGPRRHRVWLLVGLGLLVTAMGSFLIAGSLLDGGEAPRPVMDAAPPDAPPPVDAGPASAQDPKGGSKADKPKSSTGAGKPKKRSRGSSRAKKKAGASKGSSGTSKGSGSSRRNNR